MYNIMLGNLFGLKKFNKISFDDILHVINNNVQKYILISTLQVTEQSYLIKNTSSFEIEEKMIKI